MLMFIFQMLGAGLFSLIAGRFSRSHQWSAGRQFVGSACAAVVGSAVFKMIFTLIESAA